MEKIKILGLYVGTPKSLPNTAVSSIQKMPIERLRITLHGVEGDEVANKIHHGGDFRVIHHYSNKNYRHFKNMFPDIAEKFVGGSYGENILTEELTESELNIGDIYQLGTAKVQLTVTRRPCATINHGYSDERILKEVISTGRTGWFYRVLEAGEVKIGDHLSFLESPYPGLSLAYLNEQGYGKNQYSDIEFLKKCLSTNVLDNGWRNTISHHLSFLK